MPVKRSIELSITNGATREDLQDFIDEVPAGTKITVDIDIQKADRPYESDRTMAALKAQWMS